MKRSPIMFALGAVLAFVAAAQIPNAPAQLMVRSSAIGGPPGAGSGGGGGGELVDPLDPVPAFSYHVDEANGNDANDGMLVADGGTGPWQTLERALDAAEAGDFDLVAAADDINVVFRNTGDGIYDVTAHVLEGGGDDVCLGRHIRFRTHPDDSPVTFTTDSGNEATTGEITMGSSNYTFERMFWIVDESFIGSNAGAMAQRGQCWQIVDVTQLWSGFSYDADNHGIINFNNDQGGSFDGWKIVRSSFEGNASSCAIPCGNAATFYFEDFDSNVTFQDVIIEGSAALGQALYFKHAPAADPGAGNTATFTNFVFKQNTNGRGVVYGSMNRVEFTNGIFIWELVDERALFTVQAVDGAGYATGHANLFNHVTFWSASTHADGGSWGITNAHGGALAGVDNVVTNSLFINSLPTFSGTSYTHNTTLDYNLYQVTGDAAEEFGVGYSTLAAWRTQYGQDQFSQEEDAITAVAPNPDDYTSFALGASSLGKNAASDGQDMGAYDMSWLATVGAAN